jgi:hypothetical protein|tara:strand:+ start:6351 stop:6617 length:267 start_codon:yes stop_codon:yes gene_type:complete
MEVTIENMNKGIHNYMEWDEKCSDRFNSLDEETWFQIYDSGFGRAQMYFDRKLDSNMKTIINEIQTRHSSGETIDSLISNLKMSWEVE